MRENIRNFVATTLILACTPTCNFLGSNGGSAPTASPTAFSEPKSFCATANEPSQSASEKIPAIQRVFVVVLENTSAKAARAQPFLGKLAQDGVYFSNFHAITHPSQPNYIAMVAGSTYGVTSNNSVDLNVRHLGNLLEEHGKTWKAYAEGYPGNCSTEATIGNYARKHEPFISFVNVQSNPNECANIVNANTLQNDVASGKLADFSLYIPDLRNDGHDTDVAFADRAMASLFGPLLQDPRFINNMLFVVTFDEDDSVTKANQIYTAFYGPQVRAGSENSSCYDLYSLLATIEKIFGLGTLTQNDRNAASIQNVWNGN